MEELHSLDPRRQELLEARFMGGVGGSTGGSTGSTSGGTKVSERRCLEAIQVFVTHLISEYLASSFSPHNGIARKGKFQMSVVNKRGQCH